VHRADGGDKEIRDRAEGLIRRVWQTPRTYNPITDQLTGLMRALAAAFEPRPKEEALSVNVESSVRAAGLDPATFSLDLAKQYAARITVGDCHDNDLTAFRDPLPTNPHHGLIRGLVEARDSDPDRYERLLDALTKASAVIAAGAASPPASP
jgi:hypothetical protein